MPNIKCTRIIFAPQADLFAIAQDYGVRLEWDSFSREMVFLDGARQAAPGVRAWGRSRNGLAMEVEYITVNPPTVAAMRMIRGPRFFSQFSGSWKFKALGPDETLATFNYHFTTPWKHLRPIVDLALSYLLSREMDRRLHDLRRAAEKTDILRRVTAFRDPA